MAPVTRSGGAAAPIVGIKLDPPFITRVLENASETLPNIIPGSEQRIKKMKGVVSQQSTVDNTKTAYRLMAGLWNDTLAEARRLDSDSRLINGYLQCGDWVHDHIQPYMDVVCLRWPRVKNVEAWLQQWRCNGGLINGASTETILIRDTVRRVNPLMTPAQQGIELVNIYNLMTIYEDRCRMCHKNVASMNEQTYYNFLKDTEKKVFSEYYRFRSSQDKLYVLRALQSDKDLHYKWDENGNLQYFRSNGTATGIYVIP